MTLINMHTSEGDIKINLFDDKAPVTVKISLTWQLAQKNG